MKSNDEGEAESPAGKSSRVVHRNDELTTQSTEKNLHSLHGSVGKKHGDLTSNGSSNAARKGHFGPVINQVLFMFTRIGCRINHFRLLQLPRLN